MVKLEGAVLRISHKKYSCPIIDCHIHDLISCRRKEDLRRGLTATIAEVGRSQEHVHQSPDTGHAPEIYTYFCYGGEFYEQREGAAMSSLVSTGVANLHMEFF